MLNKDYMMTTNANPPAKTPSRSPQPPRRPNDNTDSRPRGRVNVAFLVFIGSLLGSLIGAAGDLGQAIDSFERLRSRFNPELCIAGSDTVLGESIAMADEWKSEFEATHAVNVSISATGSGRGVDKAARGECVNVLAMSEPMTDLQRAALLGANIEIECAAEIGYDVIAFVTDINNEVDLIQRSALSHILVGEIQTWAELGGDDQPIYILARLGSGTTDYVLDRVANYDASNGLPPNADFVPCSSNDTCLDMVLSTPGALYWVSTAWMRTQPPEYLRVIPILRGDEAPTNPLTENVNLNEYPSVLTRPLYLYVLDSDRIDDRTVEAAREFMTYVRSVRGQQVLERHHFYTHFKRPTSVPLELPPGFEVPGDGLRVICKDEAAA